ncbi:hypothetical protein DOM22_15385 [Bdellovibrio sp. ZAP7]|uniref:hypothetical protein n=1 Tax=Bdellovibrio sp. ZAP7 TaxID=2231053 RepID=UPI00115BF0BC|nr:hypothetical protein [Bdellovibrio sp. ZAP7]QDK46446.1 hypothetical protein DOM22_15385 [Bdellovibrio sp. ZAP7]
MKVLKTLVTLAILSSSTAALAQYVPAPARAACSLDALRAASFIDDSSWGSDRSEPLRVISSKGSYNSATYQVYSPLSGVTYTVEIYQARKSLSCVITSIVTE